MLIRQKHVGSGQEIVKIPATGNLDIMENLYILTDSHGY
jgi:hypothetical protein